MTAPARPALLAIFELGGYPNFLPLYQRLGFDAELVNSIRKARGWLKKRRPAVIVAEYNFQSDFRDRSSNLETLLAVLQRMPDTRLIAFYQPHQRARFEALRERFPGVLGIPHPVTEAALEACLRSLCSGGEDLL